MTGFLASILTFPGVIVHEIAHLLMCRILGIKVRKVCYFRFGNPMGYVIHEMPRSAWAGILIGFGPLLVNTALGALLGGPFIGRILASAGDSFSYIMVWLGISIAVHSFPSSGDAKAIWSALWSPSSSMTAKIIGTPLVGIIWLGALGSFFWLDFVYGAAVVYLSAVYLYNIPVHL